MVPWEDWAQTLGAISRNIPSQIDVVAKSERAALLKTASTQFIGVMRGPSQVSAYIWIQ
jgi:hypothetical protein